MRFKQKLMIRKWLMCFGVCFMAMNSMAQQQETVYMNLESLLQTAGANNLTIEQYQKEQELAVADLARAREWWLPEIYAGLETHQLWGAAMNADGGFFLDVDRGNLWTGLGMDARWDFGEGIYQSKAAGLRAGAASHFTKAERNQVLLETIKTYYGFLTAQLYNEAYREMIEQADTIVAQLQIQVEAGIRFQSEVLLAKSNRNNLKVQRLQAQNNYLEERARLVNLLNLQGGTSIVSVDTLLVPLNLLPESEWRQASADSTFINRPEYKYLQTGLQAIQTERKSTTTGLWLPELGLSTYSSYFGSLFEEVRPMRPLENPDPQVLYPTSQINVSLKWSIPIGRLTYGGRLKQYDAQIALQENRIGQFSNQVDEEVSRAKSQLLTSSQQLELAEEAQTLAREAVSQSIQRQQLGTAQPFEVFQAQEIYLQTRLEYLKAIAQYNKAQYSLYVALGNDL
jgi:outer membrane protein TolC